MSKLFEKNLASFSLKSEKSFGRKYKEDPPKLRTEFQRDRERIIPVSYTHLTLPTSHLV